MLEQKDIKNLLVFLGRVTLNGNEALALGQLQVKLNGLLKTETPQEESNGKKKDKGHK